MKVTIRTILTVLVLSHAGAAFADDGCFVFVEDAKVSDVSSWQQLCLSSGLDLEQTVSVKSRTAPDAADYGKSTDYNVVKMSRKIGTNGFGHRQTEIDILATRTVDDKVSETKRFIITSDAMDKTASYNASAYYAGILTIVSQVGKGKASATEYLFDIL